MITTQIQETLTMLQDQGAKVLSAIKTSKTCLANLQSLNITLQEVKNFFSDLNEVTAIFLVKKKYKTKVTELSNAIMAKRTQLFSSVTMALVSSGTRGVERKLPPGVKLVSSGASPSNQAGAGSSSVSGVNDLRSSHNTVSSGASVLASSPASSDATGPTSRFDYSAAATTAIDAGTGTGNANIGGHFDEEERMAMHGHADHMMYSAGHAYYYGVGRPRNLSLAAIRFQEAAEVGDSDAMMMLVKCYSHGHGVDKNMKQAHHWLHQAVVAGSPAAKTQLASLLLVDSVKSPETGTFLRDYMLSTKSGKDLIESSSNSVSNSSSSSSSQRWKGLRRQTLGPMVSAFISDAHDDSDASIVQSLSAEDSNSLSAILTEHERDIYCKEGVTLLLDAAADGDLNAQCNLGLVNQEAGNLEDAYKWYLAASNDGCPRATCLLGLQVLRGAGTPEKKKDEHKAYALFISAARGGEVDGYYYAGLCCEKGLLSESFHKRTQPNLQLAIQFYECGASEGHLECTYSYGYLLLRQAVELLAERAPGEDRRHAVAHYLTPREQVWYESTSSKGVHFLRIAADRGVADARYQLGRAYMAGIGVPYDIHAAYECFQFACNTETAGQGDESSSSFEGTALSFGDEEGTADFQQHDLYSTNVHRHNLTYAKASCEAGNILYSGFGSGFPQQKELNQAARMYALAARGGNAQAMNNLGLLLEEGKVGRVVQGKEHDEDGGEGLSSGGVPQPLLAARYYLCAASHNNADAMLNLATLLVHGRLPPGISSMQLLPLPHGPIALSLVGSGSASGAIKRGKHGKQRNSTSLTDIATWLVNNAVTPSHSPSLAQEYSLLLEDLERFSKGVAVTVAPSTSATTVTTLQEEEQLHLQQAGYDYLGVLQVEAEEQEQRQRLAREQQASEQEEGRKLVAEVMRAVQTRPPLTVAINPLNLAEPPRVRVTTMTPPCAAMDSVGGSMSAEKTPQAGKFSSSGTAGGSMSAEKTPQAGKFSTSSSLRDGDSASADNTPLGGKFSSSQGLQENVIPKNFPLPPMSIGVIGNSAVNTGKGDDKVRAQGAKTMQSDENEPVRKPTVEKKKVTKKGGAFLTSITSDLDESVGSSSLNTSPRTEIPTPNLAGTIGSLDISATNTSISATGRENSPSHAMDATTDTSKAIINNSMCTYRDGDYGYDKAAEDNGDNLSFSQASLNSISAKVKAGLPPRPPPDGGSSSITNANANATDVLEDYDGLDDAALMPPPAATSKQRTTGTSATTVTNEMATALKKPTPSLSPRTDISQATRNATSAAMFGADDDDEDEFDFSISQSRDSVAMSMSVQSVNGNINRTANSSMDASTAAVAVGDGDGVAAATTSSGPSKSSKAKSSKRKSKAPPRSLQNLSSSFEFDSSFN